MADERNTTDATDVRLNVRHSEMDPTPLHPYAQRLLRIDTMNRSVAASVPQLRRGKVWCVTCGREERVDSAACLSSGWPKCCGYTMSLDSPEERRQMKEHANG